MKEKRLVVYADYVCPYCYLSDSGVARLREGLSVEYAAYELWPAGQALARLSAPWLEAAWEQSVLPLAKELGVRLERPTIKTRTRKAHEAVAYARNEGVRDAMHDAVFRAYWQEGRDIGRIDVLMEIGGEIGLDRLGLKVALDIDQWTARVEQDIAGARHIGVDGVPAYLLLQGDSKAELRVGLQRQSELREWVRADDV